MSGNWCEMTSSTGGTGALTLTAVSGAPTMANILGASGTYRLPYAILEFSSSARTGGPIKAESGWGEVNLATLVLTRTRPETTWDGTTYDGTVPAALSFGTTANNIRVTLTPLAAFGPTIVQSYPSVSPTENLGAWPANFVNVTSGVFLTAGREYYVPFHWRLHGEYVQFGIAVSSGVAASAVKLALYDITSGGLPGVRRADLTGGTPLDGATPGLRVASATAVLPPGWYYIGIIGSHGTGLRRGESFNIITPAGTTGSGGPITYLYRAGNYATGLPDPAPAAGSLIAEGLQAPLAFFKAG